MIQPDTNLRPQAKVQSILGLHQSSDFNTHKFKAVDQSKEISIGRLPLFFNVHPYRPKMLEKQEGAVQLPASTG